MLAWTGLVKAGLGFGAARGGFRSDALGGGGQTGKRALHSAVA
jgi:hypothetical protein